MPYTKKPILILIPGLLSNHTVFAHQIMHLHDIANVKVIDIAKYSTKEKIVDAVLKATKGNFYLAGHSLGACLAFDVCLNTTRVRKLCLLNTSARGNDAKKIALRKKLIAAVKDGNFIQVATRLAGKFVHNKAKLQAVISMFLAVGEKAFIQEEEMMLTFKSYLPSISQITCPTLVIHSREDKNFSKAHHIEIAKTLPNAKLAIIEDSGHMSPMEMPQAVTALMHLWFSA